jgi:multiple sugar transport system substrate-binding protein
MRCQRLYARVLLIFILLVVCHISINAQTPIVTIVFTTPAEDALGAIRQLVELFNSIHQQIKVEHKTLSSGSDDCHRYYVTAFLAKSNSFDVFSADIIWSAEFASSGWVEPLDAYFTPKQRSRFLPGPIAGCTYKNRIWAVPWFTDSGILLYRSDLVKTPPKTWKELLATARELIEEGRIKYGYVFQGNQYEGLTCNVLELIWNNGGEVFDERNQVSLNTPEAIGGLQILVDIIASGICPPDVLSYQEEDARLIFQDGNVLFARNWPYAWSLMNQADSPVRGKVGISPLPIGPMGEVARVQSSSCLGGWNLMINRYSKNKEAAWKFIEYLTGYEGQKINSINGGRLPTRLAVYKDPEVLQVNPYYKDLYQNFLYSRPRPVSPYYSAISEIMQINFYKALTEDLSCREAIFEISRNIEKLAID